MPKKKSNEELTADVSNIKKKIQTLEKFINDEKKQKDVRVEKLENLTKDLDSAIKSAKIGVQSSSSNFEDMHKELSKKLQKSIDEFNAFQKELQEELEKVAEKDEIMEDLRSQILEKDVLIGEKDKNLNSLDEKYSKTLEELSKIKSEFKTLEVNYNQIKTLHEEVKKQLTSVEADYKDFKDKEEPIMSQNEGIRRLLNSSDQGRIYLALISADPKSLSLDDLADLLEITSVMIKPALLAMQDLEILEFNPSSREIKLVE